MVPDPRETSGHHRLRSLNEPQAVLVEVNENGGPVVVVLHNRRLIVQEILDRWRIDDEWWRERPVSRLYWHVVLKDGRSLTVFHDLLERQWWRQSY